MSGEELKYSLTADRPLHQDRVQLPQVFVRRDLVQRIAQTDALQLRQPGKALADGEIGKIIAVRYTRSELVVLATLVAARRVNNCSKTMC